MLSFYASPAEGWLEAVAADAGYAKAVYDAAVERGESWTADDSAA